MCTDGLCQKAYRELPWSWLTELHTLAIQDTGFHLIEGTMRYIAENLQSLPSLRSLEELTVILGDILIDVPSGAIREDFMRASTRTVQELKSLARYVTETFRNLSRLTIVVLAPHALQDMWTDTLEQGLAELQKRHLLKLQLIPSMSHF